MSNDELLLYIAEHMLTKDEFRTLEGNLEALETKMATKDELRALEGNLEALETKMATKDDLRETENMILTEVDRIQERSEEHYAELSTRIRNLENKVVVRSEQSTIALLVDVVSTLKTDVEYLKAKIS